MTTPDTSRSAPAVSVLLTSWNTVGDTRRCLASLHQAAVGLAYEVVAVDNGSVDGSAELLAADPRVQLIRNERNVGFAPAMNQAYRRARGEFVLLLNSDVCFHPDALRTMVGFLRDHLDAAGVSPLYLNPDGSFQQHYVQQPSFAACLAMWTQLKRVPGFRGALHRFQMLGEDFSKPRELASGSCMLMRSAVVAGPDLFDESFPVYWNDAILARELEAAGHRMWMIPDAVVTHARGASCRLLGPAIRFRHLLGGQVCYLRRTQPGYRLRLFRAVLVVDYLLRSVLGRTTVLGWSDLRAALRGDVGPLPDGDTRDWEVTAGVPPVVDHGSHAVRQLRVDEAGPGGKRFSVRQTGPSVWEASLPAPLPLARFLPPVGWLNGRIAAATLRRWLDRHAGARTLRVDEGHSYLLGWLGEDMAPAVDPDPRQGELVRG